VDERVHTGKAAQETDTTRNDNGDGCDTRGVQLTRQHDGHQKVPNRTVLKDNY
jgi:hypothetical protein